ncbi:hypothetical protein Tco_1551314 [Tanacetum coccineum]
MSWREFILGMGLHTAEEIESVGFGTYWAKNARQIPDKGDLSAYWIRISSARDFLGIAPSYTSIRDPMIRLCHRLIACSTVGRSQAPEKVTVTDLFYIKGMDVGSVNIPYLLARTNVIVRDLPKIDMAELVRLQIYEDREDTWAWVAPRPERHKVVAAGAPDAAEDAPVVDDCAQAVPAPMLDRLKEDVHGLRGALGEQREVLDSMACDFSRFTTWTVIGLSRMMNQDRVRYTSYSDYHIRYVRRTQHRTGDASTSTA